MTAYAGQSEHKAGELTEFGIECAQRQLDTRFTLPAVYIDIPVHADAGQLRGHRCAQSAVIQADMQAGIAHVARQTKPTPNTQLQVGIKLVQRRQVQHTVGPAAIPIGQCASGCLRVSIHGFGLG